MLEITMMMRFWRMVSSQTISLTLSGFLKGFRKMFHFEYSSSSERMRNTSPNTTMITAVALPFLTTL